jgi:NAD(P)-dependent dehydrogenase (short-subunit alcohol dehydrogenase family)
LASRKKSPACVSFLCGPDAGYVTGQAWAIDGGMTM